MCVCVCVLMYCDVRICCLLCNVCACYKAKQCENEIHQLFSNAINKRIGKFLFVSANYKKCKHIDVLTTKKPAKGNRANSSKIWYNLFSVAVQIPHGFVSCITRAQLCAQYSTATTYTFDYIATLTVT